TQTAPELKYTVFDQIPHTFDHRARRSKPKENDLWPPGRLLAVFGLTRLPPLPGSKLQALTADIKYNPGDNKADLRPFPHIANQAFQVRKIERHLAKQERKLSEKEKY